MEDIAEWINLCIPEGHQIIKACIAFALKNSKYEITGVRYCSLSLRLKNREKKPLYKLKAEMAPPSQRDLIHFLEANEFLPKRKLIALPAGPIGDEYAIQGVSKSMDELTISEIALVLRLVVLQAF